MPSVPAIPTGISSPLRWTMTKETDSVTMKRTNTEHEVKP
jgi:hypothetical protein